MGAVGFTKLWDIHHRESFSANKNQNWNNYLLVFQIILSTGLFLPLTLSFFSDYWECTLGCGTGDAGETRVPRLEPEDPTVHTAHAQTPLELG